MKVEILLQPDRVMSQDICKIRTHDVGSDLVHFRGCAPNHADLTCSAKAASGPSHASYGGT